MGDGHDVELRIAVAEGILSRADANALAEEARRTQRSPLSLLVEQGRLSADSFASLRAEAARVDLGRDETLVAGTPPPAAGAPEAPVFPVAAWDRYASIRFLGRGGMGKIFLAFDPRLRREVALKFVHGDDPDHVRRLIAEARAQAQVSHERVCKVHEVGEVDGKVYIAMEYIDGQPLGSLAGELTVEQKVMLVRGAAEGIHEAHRAGIIHRDLKPSNIMVARGEGGELRPYVMDFGLARTAREDDATLSGTVLGTPRYMAPEQARGEVGKLDRRADVYSLGATLYHLLTGEPPIPGSTPMEVLHHLAAVEPRPMRALDPDLPIDLDLIVLKCLAKDRSARYDSARALAEDLGRFLDGEPVLSRAPGAWYRLRKRLAKHRRLVAAGAAALVALGIAVGWGLQARRDASERERLARRFTEQVERIEAMARYAALSPLHDVREDRAAIRARIAELDDEVRRAGTAAVGPGRYAIGRGYLALDDHERARERLEAAWRHGFREPRVAYALALAMGHLYRRGLLAAERIEQKAVREAKQRELEQQYRDPALAYLAESKGAEVPSTAYVAALVAFYEGRLDEALRHLEAIGRLPWFYEAPALRGDILLARALGLRNQGERERARIDFEAGRVAYAAAAEVGESVPAVYRSRGELEYAAMVMELYGRGDVMPPFQRGIEATGRALAVLPDDYDALVLRARLQRSLAEHQANQGSDAEALIAKAIADGQRAVAIAPALPQARVELARIYRQWGEARAGRSQDPGEQLRKAIEISEGIAPEDRDAAYHGNLGLIFKIWADHEDEVGADARANRGKAIEAYTRALQLDERMNDVWMNLGITYFARASQPRAADPDGDLQQALQALGRARSLNPRHIVPYFYEGEIYRSLAQRAWARRADPDPDLARSLDAYRRGLVVNPRLPHLHNGIGITLLEQARAAWTRGVDPAPLLEQARAAFEQAIAVAPDQGFGYSNVGDVLARRAGLQLSRGEDPSASLRAALQILKQALERIPDHPTFRANLGMVHAILAAYELEQGRDPRSSLAAAEAALRGALAKNPKSAQAQRYLGETHGILARLRARQGQGRSEDFEEAARAFQRAIDLAPENQEHRLAFGHFCRAWATARRALGEDPGPPLQRGLELAAQVLARHPRWPEARILRGSLLLSQAQLSGGAEERRELAATAAEELAGALAGQPVFDKVWRPQAALARQLASAPR